MYENGFIIRKGEKMDEKIQKKCFSELRSQRLKQICAELKAMKQTSYREYFARKSMLFGFKRKTMLEYFEQLYEAKLINIDTLTDTISYIGD